MAITLYGSKQNAIQIVSTSTGSQTTLTSNGSYINYTGVDTVITPSSASNKVLVTVCLQVGPLTSTGCYPSFRLTRNGTAVALGSAASSATQATFGALWAGQNCILQSTTFTFLDSPATTGAVTYSIQYLGGQGTRTAYINATEFQGAIDGRTGVSTMTCMEIAYA